VKVIITILGALIIGAVGFFGGVYYKNSTYSAVKCPSQLTSTSATPETAVSAVKTAVPSSNGIKLTSPVAGATVSSPLEISGEALGSWYFEGEFTVTMTDANGAEIATAVATAQGEWMTESYVPFTATIAFTKQSAQSGYLVLKKSNPSGQVANDQEYKVKINF